MNDPSNTLGNSPSTSPLPPSANSLGASKNDQSLTFVVFKDGLTSRSFQVSARWISKLGLSLAALAIITIGALFFAARTYLELHQARKTGVSGRVHELEAELAELKAGLLTAGAQSQPLAHVSGIPIHGPVPPPGLVNSAPPPPAAPALTPAPPVGTTPQTTSAGGTLFSAFPGGTATTIPDRASLPFKIVQAKATWRGGILRVGFALQYTRDDGGNQQGHIVVLARGPETLLAYPEGVLNGTASDTLIKPDAGEYFSVSRFREVNAEFGPIPTRDQITEVQVLILDTRRKLLVQERFIPEKPAARRRSESADEEAPSTTDPASRAAPTAPSAPAATAAPTQPAQPANPAAAPATTEQPPTPGEPTQ